MVCKDNLRNQLSARTQAAVHLRPFRFLAIWKWAAYGSLLPIVNDGQVTFRWRDSAHHNEQKLMALSLDEFLRRFLLHILPQGFVRIRNFGFLANRRRATLLPLCFHLLGSAQQPQTEQNLSSTDAPSDLWHCPKCAGPMKVIERLTAAEIQLRSPPMVTAAA
jgi:Putative transposase